ncbi:MAG: ABC transporter ATP-binding protein [Treponema sp.]|jgi:peptide/nickel transport system ATP-binding protein|nr:ABC transporter ATP-binding protein [Treponema sp.]
MNDPVNDPVLNIEDLCCDFLTVEGIVYALSGMSLKLRRGEIHGIVGESGCGKSVSARAVMGLLEKKHSRIKGAAFFDGRDLLKLHENEMRDIRGRRISMVFQDPLNSLSPLETVGNQIEEAMANHFPALSKEKLRNSCLSLLEKVGLHPGTAGQYPFELSGGMQQRIMIAQAISCEPEILIADEPTTALDVTIQAQVLELLKTLQREMKLSVLLITHNFAVVAGTCDRVSVMYSGRIVETAPTESLINNAAHPYSRALIGCIPRGRSGTGGHLPVIPGFPPRLYEPAGGCPFAPRCASVSASCRAAPPVTEIEEGHLVFCHHPLGEALHG